MICGLSSGLAASGLAWAGLAAGERKKVLIVLDLGRGGWRVPKLPNYEFGGRLMRLYRSRCWETSGVFLPLRRRAQTGQNPTTGFEHAN